MNKLIIHSAEIISHDAHFEIKDNQKMGKTFGMIGAILFLLVAIYHLFFNSHRNDFDLYFYGITAVFWVFVLIFWFRLNAEKIIEKATITNVSYRKRWMNYEVTIAYASNKKRKIALPTEQKAQQTVDFLHQHQ
ncbi:hypothetical protein [Bergeyella zoohelcum]|uniref:Uncharacterized protein n=1 Tax=Bergeyella zoohelcum ATCC 43767 TaxID=883096 RepID=K1M4T5_9FLAO|nr:hypothetical protein [Bergeyella zoohelcum]EKB57418.1 hypothetical protein HMPREF9699_00904 [Bergeyella zoohelcum ATCC 43767]SUV48911.1 Uncharacterised protein [Bergeyella zoohelcum]